MAHPPWKMWQKLHIFFQHKLRLVDKKTDGNGATCSSTIIFFINGQGLFWNRQVGIVPVRMRLIGRQIFARQVAGISMSVLLSVCPSHLWHHLWHFPEVPSMRNRYGWCILLTATYRHRFHGWMISRFSAAAQKLVIFSKFFTFLRTPPTFLIEGC